jgi:hypothetical protein
LSIFARDKLTEADFFDDDKRRRAYSLSRRVLLASNHHAVDVAIESLRIGADPTADPSPHTRRAAIKRPRKQDYSGALAEG